MLFPEIDPKKVRAIMSRELLTLEKAAKRGRFTTASLSYWLSGKRKPKIKSIQKLAKALGVDAKDITK